MTRKFAQFLLGPSDMAVIRFGISPSYELVHALRALVRPEYSPVHRAWRRDLRRPVPKKAVQLATAVCGIDGSTPDFLTSSPVGEMTFREEIERLRGVPDERVRQELSVMAERAVGVRREVLGQMITSPQRTRAAVVEAWEQLWNALLAPFWPQLLQLMRSDVAARSRRIGDVGLAQMVGGLHSTVSWRQEAIQVEISRQLEIDCGGSGLVLVPSAMMPPCGCAVLIDESEQPTIFYPARGVSESWHRDLGEVEEALSALLGTGRAKVLLELYRPLSTSESALGAGLAISTVSHHLSVLRRAGLVDSRRDGTRIMHSRTAMGEALIWA